MSDSGIDWGEFEDEPDELRMLYRAAESLWEQRARWIHSLKALRGEAAFTQTVARLGLRSPSSGVVIGWIRQLYKSAPTGPDCAGIAMALELLPSITSDQSLRSALLPLLGLKGASFKAEQYRAGGELVAPEDDCPTWPVTLDDVVVPAVALRVIEAVQGIEPPALSLTLRWLNGYWTRQRTVLSELARLVDGLVAAGDVPMWTPGQRITPPWAIEALAENSALARGDLSALARRIRRAEVARAAAARSGPSDDSGSRLRRLTRADPRVLTKTQIAARDRAISALTGEPARSVLLVGKRGSGSTTIADGVSQALTGMGIAVLVAAPTDISAGAVYTNQLDGRLQAALDELAREDAVWFAPGWDSATTLGRHAQSQRNLADRVTDALAAGRLRLVAEVTEEGYQQLLRESPRFAQACVPVRIETPPVEELRIIAATVLEDAADRAGRAAPLTAPGALDLAVEICDDLLPHLAQPAAVARLLGAVDLEPVPVGRDPEPDLEVRPR